jgi:nucleoside 2-deoxyribosyltransferase
MASGKSGLYLAGGFRTGWQAGVFERLTNFEIFDPSGHSIADPVEYTEWDLKAIRDCDVVLANMEDSNPGGYALAMEIGFAKALGKKIVFVDQISDPHRKRYFEMVRQASDRVFSSLADALDYLSSRPDWSVRSSE